MEYEELIRENLKAIDEDFDEELEEIEESESL